MCALWRANILLVSSLKCPIKKLVRNYQCLKRYKELKKMKSINWIFHYLINSVHNNDYKEHGLILDITTRLFDLWLNYLGSYTNYILGKIDCIDSLRHRKTRISNLHLPMRTLQSSNREQFNHYSRCYLHLTFMDQSVRWLNRMCYFLHCQPNTVWQQSISSQAWGVHPRDPSFWYPIACLRQIF